MTEKEEQVLHIISDFYKKNKVMPSIRFIQKELDYKSSNSITQFMKSLEKQHYLIRNGQNKLVLNQITNNENYKTIKIINSNKDISILLTKDKKYIGYSIKNNYFIKDNIIKNDILIIEINKKVNNNDLGLFIIDKKYRVMKYFYKDGFHILEDNERIILNKIKLIGKVVMIERTI